jgi:hypothetical protein
MGLRYAAALALILSAPAAAERTSPSAIVALARDYLRAWEQSLAAVVAEERYTQTLKRYTRLGVLETDGPGMRTLVSDVLLVRAPGEDAWLMFRDVFSVDGEPVRDRKQRFEQLFVRPDANLVASARRIADEGARYNLGSLFRNLNTPATAFVFLDEKYESSVAWRDAKQIDRDGVKLRELEFEQKRPPFAIGSLNGQTIHTSGSMVVEEQSGRIVQTELLIRIARTRTYMRLRCDFGPVPGIDTWVPMRMAEEYERQSQSHEELKAQAVYTNHRVFQTQSRIIGEEP